VYVVDGATCDVTNKSGCAQAPAVVKLASHPPVGSNPSGIAVDEATDTVYTSNSADDEHPGTVSVINGASCNGSDHSGCGRAPATAPAGFGAYQVTIDQLTNQVYVTNLEDASVTTINGNTCNGTNTAGCANTQTEATAGDYPAWVSVDPAVGTAYVTDDDAGVAVIALASTSVATARLAKALSARHSAPPGRESNPVSARVKQFSQTCKLESEPRMLGEQCDAPLARGWAGVGVGRVGVDLFVSGTPLPLLVVRDYSASSVTEPSPFATNSLLPLSARATGALRSYAGPENTLTNCPVEALTSVTELSPPFATNTSLPETAMA
jgi:hypothetical protein